MSLKWSESVMFRFLDLYRKHDCLWNRRLVKYKNRDTRKNALASIVNEMKIADLTISDVTNKIKSVRTMYKREHSLVWKSKKSGTKEYVPKLVWYTEADKFLSGVLNIKDDTSSSLILSQHYEAEDETFEDDAEDADQNEAENIHKNKYPVPTFEYFNTGDGNTREELNHVKNTGITHRSILNKSKTTQTLPRIPHSLKRKMPTNDNTAAIDKVRVVQSDKNETADEIDMFAKHISIQLKQMPAYDAILCQEKIQTIVRQKRLELLSRQSKTQTITLPPLSHMPRRTPSPQPSTAMEEDYSLSSISNESSRRIKCEEDSENPSDIELT